MLTIYSKVTIEKKWRNLDFKSFISRFVFGELQLAQISLYYQTSYCNLKIRGLGPKLCVACLLLLFWKELWRFKVKESMLFVDYFYFDWNYDVLKSKSPYFLLNKNIRFHKNETELKMKNLTHSFTEINHVIQLV